MSVVARLLSSGVARGLAALLALLLSAVIGGRLGVDRLALDLADDEHTPVACPMVADLPADLPLAPSTGDPRLSFVDVCDPVATGVPAREDHRPPTGLLRGSAGGPRAP
jgi:hypothetical protein